MSWIPPSSRLSAGSTRADSKSRSRTTSVISENSASIIQNGGFLMIKYLKIHERMEILLVVNIKLSDFYPIPVVVDKYPLHMGPLHQEGVQRS